MMTFDPKSGLWLSEKPRLCSLFPAIHGIAGASGPTSAIAKVQSKNNTAIDVTQVAVTLDAGPTQDNLLVAVGWMTDASPEPLHIVEAGWKKAQPSDLQVTFGFDDGTLQVFYKIAGVSEGSTVTLAGDGATQDDMGIHVMEWSGMDTVLNDVRDVRVTNDETGGTSRIADTGTTPASTYASSLAIAACVIADNDFDATPTLSNGFTLDADLAVGDGGTDSTLAVGYKILSATGTQNMTSTWTGGGGAEQRFSMMVVFRGAGATARSSGASANYDGTNDYLTRGQGLTGAVDSKKGSVVFSFSTSKSGGIAFLHATGDRVRFRKRSTGVGSQIIMIQAFNSTPTKILDIRTTTQVGDGEVHTVMASWDLGAGGGPVTHLYLDGVSDKSVNTATDDTIDYTTDDWSVGALVDGSNKLDGDLAHLWFEDGVIIDFSLAAERAKFVDSTGRLADKGSDGSIPTGTSPIIFVKDDEVNAGTGGGFTENGALTAGADFNADPDSV